MAVSSTVTALRVTTSAFERRSFGSRRRSTRPLASSASTISTTTGVADAQAVRELALEGTPSAERVSAPKWRIWIPSGSSSASARSWKRWWALESRKPEALGELRRRRRDQRAQQRLEPLDLVGVERAP